MSSKDKEAVIKNTEGVKLGTSTTDRGSILEMIKLMFGRIVTDRGLLDIPVAVVAKTLTPEEAIGNPGRRDFPIVVGKERVVEAEVAGVKAHAYTDSPGEFVGSLKEILALPLTSNRERAIFIATVNGVLKSLDIVKDTLHCRDEEPEKCAKEIASTLLEQYGRIKVGLVGMNPAIAEAVVETFGSENVRITDINFDTIDTVKFGVMVWNGRSQTEKLVVSSDVILITGTTLVNGTFDTIWRALQDPEKQYFIYGITGSGICELMGFNRLCPYGRS
jgi:uncharacterized protein (DUF4213/DUF364 family)